MKLYTTIKNERGGKKSTGDDTRIYVELSYKNKILGTIGLYAIIDDKVEGCRIIWREEGKGYDPDEAPLLELVQNKKGKSQKGEKCKHLKCFENPRMDGDTDRYCVDCEKYLGQY